MNSANRIQNQHRKISCIPLYKQRIIWKFKTIPFTIASKRIKYSEINQREKKTCKTLYNKNIAKRNWRWQINGNTSRVHGF